MRNQDVLRETMIRFSDPADIATLPGKPSVANLRKWAQDGVIPVTSSDPDDRITLEHARFGGRIVTSLEAVQRFHARVNGKEA